jgi:hypothetical protein
MTSYSYTAATGIFTYVDKEAGFQMEIHFEDGIRSDVFRENTVAFFYSRRHDETNQVKTVMAIDQEGNEMNISIRKPDNVYIKYTLPLTPTIANSLYNIGKIYRHQQIAPDFSFKHIGA